MAFFFAPKQTLGDDAFTLIERKMLNWDFLNDPVPNLHFFSIKIKQ